MSACVFLGVLNIHLSLQSTTVSSLFSFQNLWTYFENWEIPTKLKQISDRRLCQLPFKILLINKWVLKPKSLFDDHWFRLNKIDWKFVKILLDERYYYFSFFMEITAASNLMFTAAWLKNNNFKIVLILICNKHRG